MSKKKPVFHIGVHVLFLLEAHVGSKKKKKKTVHSMGSELLREYATDVVS